MSRRQSPRPRRVLFVAVHPPTQAVARLRGAQFESYFRAAGFEYRLHSFIPAGAGASWVTASTAGRLLAAGRGLLGALMLPWLVIRADVVIVLKEAVPFGSAIIERLAARCSRLIWDVDDAVWERTPRAFFPWAPHRLRGSGLKYERVCRLADEVWAGSEFLADWCRLRSDQVRVVPTVVGVPATVPGRGERDVVGWVGSTSTAGFLAGVLPAICPLPEPARLRVVGADVALPCAGDVEPWSAEAEARLLREALVGLYPVDEEHALAAGTAGLKAILYMAHGVPSVVTPTDTISGLVRDGIEGIHAREPDDWSRGVRSLLEDDALWERMSRAGRERALAEYSTQQWGPKLVEAVESLLARPSRPEE
jgi:hypothetical protein